MFLAVAGYGIQSPTGTDAPMSVASVMGGISRIQRNKHIEDRHFEPVSMGMAQYLYDELPNLGRFIELALPAFEEAIAPLSAIQPSPGTIPVYLGLPKDRPGLDTDIEQELISELRGIDLGTNIQFKFTCIREDHDSGLIALAKVSEHFRNSETEFCIIGGVDSFVSEETIAWLEKQRIVKCTANRFGIIPGEAASFCLLCSSQTAEKYNIPVSARILGFGTAQELNMPGSEQVTSGEAFKAAVQQATTLLPEGEKIAEILCMLKGMRHEADEFAYCNVAMGNHLEKPGEYLSLTPRWGDVGAASSPVLLAFVAERKKLGFTEAAYNLVFTMSPGGSRSAALIQTV